MGVQIIHRLKKNLFKGQDRPIHCNVRVLKVHSWGFQFYTKANLYKTVTFWILVQYWKWKTIYNYLKRIFLFVLHYLCESGLSSYTSTKTMYHNRLNVEADIRSSCFLLSQTLKRFNAFWKFFLKLQDIVIYVVILK